VEKRLKQHNARANRGWTNRFSDWEVVYQETCETRLEARRRERQLKKMRGTKKYKELLGLVCVEKAPTRSAQSKNRKA
jgi:predicted GIY-YIG superfamily endonuclease